MLEDPALRTEQVRLLTSANSTSSLEGPAKCGRKNSPNARQNQCRRQHRAYGLLPIVEGDHDISTRRYTAKRQGDQLPDVPTVGDHGFVLSMYERTHMDIRGRPLLFLSMKHRSAPDSVYAAPDSTPGAVGYAFGYYGALSARKQAVFHIVRVYVNPAYRKYGRGDGGNDTSVTALKRLATAAIAEARDCVGATIRTLEIRPHDAAPCLQVGHEHSLLDPVHLLALYTNAGFHSVSQGAGNPLNVYRLHTFT